MLGAAVIAAMGFLLYEVLFASFFEGQMAVATREAPIWWAVVLSALSHGLLVALVIGWAGDASLMGGLKAGAIVGFLVWFGGDMILFAVYEFATLPGALMDSVLATVQYGLAGAAIGAVTARDTAAAAERSVGRAAPGI